MVIFAITLTASLVTRRFESEGRVSRTGARWTAQPDAVIPQRCKSQRNISVAYTFNTFKMSIKSNIKIVNNEQKKTDDLLMKSTYHSYNLQCFRSWLWFFFPVEYCFFLCWFFLVWTAKLDNGLRAHTTNKRFVGQQQNYKYIYDHIKMVYEIIVRIQIWQDFVIIYKKCETEQKF